MIKLEDVSTIDLIRHCKYVGEKNRVYRDIYNLLVSSNIDNFQQLKVMLESEKIVSECVFEILNDYLCSVIQRLNCANEMGRILEVFTFDSYENSMIDDETLSITDSQTNGDVLLYTIPYIRGGARIGQLKYLSITDIKQLLRYVDDYHLKNIFSRKRNFGLNSTKRVANVINFYEQQVLRQAKETDERGINLFTLNKDLKDEIVEAEIKYIAEYIVDNAKECIWGSMTDTQKKRIMRAVVSTCGESLQRDKMMLVNAISNYTTLSELQEGVIRKRTLDRFIVRSY